MSRARPPPIQKCRLTKAASFRCRLIWHRACSPFWPTRKPGARRLTTCAHGWRPTHGALRRRTPAPRCWAHSRPTPNLTLPPPRRSAYAGRAQAAVATAARCMAAATARLLREHSDEVTLDSIAAEAGVTVQTVIRRFGSKEGLVQAIVEVTGSEVRADRDGADQIGRGPG